MVLQRERDLSVIGIIVLESQGCPRPPERGGECLDPPPPSPSAHISKPCLRPPAGEGDRTPEGSPTASLPPGPGPAELQAVAGRAGEAAGESMDNGFAQGWVEWLVDGEGVSQTKAVRLLFRSCDACQQRAYNYVSFSCFELANVGISSIYCKLFFAALYPSCLPSPPGGWEEPLG